MKESDFWADKVKPRLPETCTYRLENGVARGMPDVNVSWSGRELWLELKVFKGNRIEVRFSQFKWLRNRIKHGLENTFIVALHKEEIWTWHGRRILEHTTTESRETEDSIVFVPPPPDCVVRLDLFNTTYLRDWLFGEV